MHINGKKLPKFSSSTVPLLVLDARSEIDNSHMHRLILDHFRRNCAEAIRDLIVLLRHPLAFDIGNMAENRLIAVLGNDEAVAVSAVERLKSAVLLRVDESTLRYGIRASSSRRNRIFQTHIRWIEFAILGYRANDRVPVRWRQRRLLVRFRCHRICRRIIRPGLALRWRKNFCGRMMALTIASRT